MNIYILYIIYIYSTYKYGNFPTYPVTLDDTQPQEVVHQNKSRWFSDFGTNFASILGVQYGNPRLPFNMNSTIDFGFFFSKWAGCLCICVYMIYIYI